MRAPGCESEIIIANLSARLVCGPPPGAVEIIPVQMGPMMRKMWGVKTGVGSVGD
jgi:hypothetical protein